MTATSLLRFLEDFGRPSAVQAAQAVAVPEFQPAHAATAPFGNEKSLEDALAEAREEGASEARAELEERHRAELQQMRTEFEIAAQKARDAEISALTDAMEGLFAQYDAWLDRLFETSLRPLIARIAHAAALEEFKSRLLAAADSEGMAIKLAGPENLVRQMAEMLGSHGLKVDTQVSESGELHAEIDKQSLQTRLGRIDELLSSGVTPSPEARDA
jgi:hypothetical protein